MIKMFTTLFLLFLFSYSKAQVGIGTTTPRGALDINETTTGTSIHGLVIPKNNANAIINPQGETIVPGTIIFDLEEKCLKYFRKRTNSWSNCISRSKEPVNP